jgi:hypothetical protein
MRQQMPKRNNIEIAALYKPGMFLRFAFKQTWTVQGSELVFFVFHLYLGSHEPQFTLYTTWSMQNTAQIHHLQVPFLCLSHSHY